MDKAYFPMFVDISKKKILIVGGGTVATRRVQTLVQFAVDITVIAPVLSGTLKKMEAMGAIQCLAREYRTEDIRNADIVLIATNQKELNGKIVEECRDMEREQGRRILLNVADSRILCDFYFPSVIKNDEIVIAINSGGKNPGKVKKLRKRLQDLLPFF